MTEKLDNAILWLCVATAFGTLFGIVGLVFAVIEQDGGLVAGWVAIVSAVACNLSGVWLARPASVVWQ